MALAAADRQVRAWTGSVIWKELLVSAKTYKYVYTSY